MATIEQRMYDGDRAREVLENPAFAQAFADIKQEYVNAWMQSPARDKEGREALFLMVKLTEKLQVTLEAALTNGKMARLDQEYQMEQMARDRREGVQIG